MAISSSNIRHVFLTGLPGVGKTTLIRQIVEQLQSKSISAQGFYTAEVRSGGSGKRCGFDVVTLSGKTGQLSRVGAAGRGPSVGQYIVDLPSFESVALPELTLKDDPKVAGVVLIIDEIGKMELFSQNFYPIGEKTTGPITLLDSRNYTCIERKATRIRRRDSEQERCQDIFGNKRKQE